MPEPAEIPLRQRGLGEVRDWLAAQVHEAADEALARLLTHATGFVFVPDLPDAHLFGHYWMVRLDGGFTESGGSSWVYRWAYSLRCWSKARGDWLRAEETEPWHPHARWWDEVHFTLAQAMEALPGILAVQAERARATEAERLRILHVPMVGSRAVNTDG